MSAERAIEQDYQVEQAAEVIPFPRKEGNLVVRLGGAMLDAAKIVLLGPDYTDKNG